MQRPDVMAPPLHSPTLASSEIRIERSLHVSLPSPESTAALGGPSWLVTAREHAATWLADTPAPSSRAEVWRYSPIDDLDLARFDVAASAAAPRSLGSLEPVGRRIKEVELAAGPCLVDGVTVSRLSDTADGQELLSSVATADEYVVALSLASLSDGLVVDVPRGTLAETPIVIVHELHSGIQARRTIVRAAAGSSVTVIEVWVGGGATTLSLPVTELLVDDGANVAHASIQLLDDASWHLGTVKSHVGRDGVVAQLTAGFGAAYDRCRSDVTLAGQGASSILRSTYLGSGDQIHDLRTHQIHEAPRTISDLLCKGAVTGTSRSVYTGLITMRHGASRAEANQTNHNLVLSDGAHADSVPNLDIAENDVRCSHASTVGPLDEDQRFYLEARGIEPVDAERLLVGGFFKDLLDRSSIGGARSVVAEILGERLEGAGLR